jgi:acetate kinase
VATILTLNAGSSSIKFALFEAHEPEPKLLFRGVMDRQADDAAFVIEDAAGRSVPADRSEPTDTKSGIADTLLRRIETMPGGRQIDAVGHRIVHGGPKFTAPVMLDAKIVDELARLTPMAPLHQPACLELVSDILSSRPSLRQIACFDTAFHRTLDPIYRRFALPRDFEAKGIRRYGFHGLSFEHIARHCGRPGQRMVVAHLGAGASVCAIRDGRSVNTSMSMTPLDGLMMATRSGAIDPGAILYLQKSQGMSVAEVEHLLYHESGLLGVSGISADMRVLLASDDTHAKQAVDQFCARVAEQIAVMATSMNGMDLMVFTGGIGEHSPEIRDKICARLEWLGLGSEDRQSNGDHRVQVKTIPANEELVIAIHTRNLTRGQEPGNDVTARPVGSSFFRN